ncbi:hypothetical protein [Streptomyces sp. NPDC048643]|uniref:hypothetical protein n=1 Tax=Streptomyces sp. NPDC048643 TaxID=3155637 RepID=UPI003432DB56
MLQFGSLPGIPDPAITRVWPASTELLAEILRRPTTDPRERWLVDRTLITIRGKTKTAEP